MAKPEWLTIAQHSDNKYSKIKQTIQALGMNTVCVEAHCPNITECWDSGTATFMVLGDKCTRGCRFCAVKKMAHGVSVDQNEPEKLALAISKWGLDYVVITAVCRDDLQDQGASHFARCITAIREKNPDTLIEVLAADFRGEQSLIRRVVDAKPDVFGHNIETVERLTPIMRDRRASYNQSLEVLRYAKRAGCKYTKSAIMLGAGERQEEVLQALSDLRTADVDFVAIGQYLQPSKFQLEVAEYVAPARFEEYKQIALDMGFKYAAAGPFVRSSYKAGEYFIKNAIKSETVVL